MTLSDVCRVHRA